MNLDREQASWPSADYGSNVAVEHSREVTMRSRNRVLQSLENVYRSAFAAADEVDDTVKMASLDVDYQRDQLQLEVLLDIRTLLTPEVEDKTISLLEKAHTLRKLTRLR